MRGLISGLLLLCATLGKGDRDSSEHPGMDCLPEDGSLSPRCEEYVNPITREPVFIEHQWNCSRFWICGPDMEHCLNECAPMAEGGNLFFDKRIQYPYGPVCNWPWDIDCEMGTTPRPTTAPPCNCETWQDCNHGICSPDCKIDDHCDADEYCDYNEGGSGTCHTGCRNGAECGKCGDCVAHVCQEPECCSDADCLVDQFCYNGVCKYECIVDADCADNQYCDEHHSCQVGCRNDLGCPGCATCDSHVCSQPECCVDSDCLDSGKPICDENICKAGCRDNSDCPGSDAICNSAYDNCQWCNSTNANIGQCNPGCIDNSNCANGLECTGNHICNSIGSTVLKTIQLDTEICTGCMNTFIEEGVWIQLTGEIGASGDLPSCQTLILDHPDRLDYDAGKQAIFDTDFEEDKVIMDSCYKANLHTGITEGTLIWTAEQGEWTPSNKQITLKWSDPSLTPLCCCLNIPTLTPQTPQAQITQCKRCPSSPASC